MAGLAEILEENQRLRDLLAAREASVGELAALREAAAQQRAALEAVTTERDLLKERVDELERAAELLRLRRERTSQRFEGAHQEAFPFLAQVVAPARAPQAEAEPSEESEKKPKSRGSAAPRRRDRDAFSHLRSKQVICPADPNARCAGCGRSLRIVGKAESFRIGWVPGYFVREDVVRDKCTCDHCPHEGVLTVPAPYALNRALCADSLLARIIVDKFADHLPLNRQAARMEREGLGISTTTLSAWVVEANELLRVVAEAIRADLFESPFLQGDDTGMPVQDGTDGKLRRGRMWAYTDQQQVVYQFTDTKHGTFPVELLKGYTGTCLLVDGGSEFNAATADLERAGCWSHFRSYFCDALPFHPAEAALALATLRDLFMLERGWLAFCASDRLAARKRHAAPLIDSLMNWVKALSQHVRPKSKLAEAVGYGIRQEERLRVCLHRGDVPIHNNLSELMLRQTVVGRKNWLFARSEGGALAAASMFTIIGSCKLQGVVPFDYLLDVLPRIQDCPTSRVRSLTPRAWRLGKRHPEPLG